MPGAVGIQFKFPDWEQRLKGSLDELMLFVAAQMQTNRGLLFDAEGGINGHAKWEPLKLRNGMALSRRGNLRRSLAPMHAQGQPGPDGIVRIVGETVTIGTTLGYARLMNDGTTKLPGGVLRPKRGKALMIPLPPEKARTEQAKKLAENAVNKADVAAHLARLKRQMAKARSQKRKDYLAESIRRAEKRMQDTPKEQKWIFRKSVKIPARPFDQWTAEDQHELEVALRNKLIEILEGTP